MSTSGREESREVAEARRKVLWQAHRGGIDVCQDCEDEVDALVEAVRKDERERRRVIVECRDCEYKREADSPRWAEELRHNHEARHETHNVWLAAPPEGGTEG